MCIDAAPVRHRKPRTPRLDRGVLGWWSTSRDRVVVVQAAPRRRGGADRGAGHVLPWRADRVTLAFPVHRAGVEGVCDDGVGHCVAHFLQTLLVDVGERVTGLVVAGVVRDPRLTAKDRRLRGRLHALSAGEQPPGGDAVEDEPAVVAAPAERGLRRREALTGEVAVEQRLDRARSGWARGRARPHWELRVVAVVDESDVVRRTKSCRSSGRARSWLAPPR